MTDLDHINRIGEESRREAIELLSYFGQRKIETHIGGMALMRAAAMLIAGVAEDERNFDQLGKDMIKLFAMQARESFERRRREREGAMIQ